MKREEIIELLHTVFQICELELQIMEYDEKMKKQKNGLGECDQTTPETPGP